MKRHPSLAHMVILAANLMARATLLASAACAKCVSDPADTVRSTREEPVHLSDSLPETHQHCSPAVLIAATRCYLIQMLRSALTRANGCSCWSADEENSARFFLTHGCALPTELGGQVTVLQLDTDIVAAMLMKRPINPAFMSTQRQRCYQIAAASTHPTRSSSAHLASSTLQARPYSTRLVHERQLGPSDH